MLYTNVTRIKDFFILGFPGLLPQYYGPVSALLFVLYLVIAAGNIFILVFVKIEHSLHKPSYLIFCHLALSDLLFGTVTLPKTISKYWFNDSIISFYSCFVQMYFVHFLGAAHSFILMVMALDRFIAICVPLRYTSLFTNITVNVLCGISWLLPMSWMIGVIFDVLRVPFCNSNIIAQCYCDHLSIINLGCENVREVTIVAFSLAMFSLLLPLSFIILSYFVIIVAVLRISSSDSRIRTLSTCSPQLIITCLYFMPRCFVYLANYVGYTFNISVRTVVVMLYSLLPAAVNPLIYCLKTKDIKENLKLKLLQRKKNVVESEVLPQVEEFKYLKANQKPWLTAEVYRLLRARNTTFTAGDQVGLRAARNNLSRGIRKAKKQYSRKIAHRFSDSKDTRSLWRGIQTIMNYKPAPQTCDSTTSTLNELNDFFAWFEACNSTPEQKLSPSPNDKVLTLSTDSVRRSFIKINARKASGPDNIPGRVLKDCAAELAAVFTDIFNISLTLLLLPQ
ncbi:olfactory receptor 52E8-like [Nematolebias whitei]|uniref:olfactory receptor 52E8-like n=1 Tax=Nematolebias whitei TaxID=451745 RepID=UPI001899ACDB|nr:olfactory receptor 52E8-like [Nematolebias whitei]